jgi:hypothetical protein
MSISSGCEDVVAGSMASILPYSLFIPKWYVLLLDARNLQIYPIDSIYLALAPLVLPDISQLHPDVVHIITTPLLYDFIDDAPCGFMGICEVDAT